MDWVFAYGSNMHLPDLRRWLRAAGYADHGPARVEVASIADFALAWNYRSASRAGGAANAVPQRGGELRGLVLEVDHELLAALDAKEGHPARYDRGTHPLRARLRGGEGHVEAWLYRVTPAYEVPHDEPPRQAYLDLLLEAAEEHALGHDYVAALRSIPTVP